MANLDFLCSHCGSNQLFTRTSKKICNTLEIKLFCKSCASCEMTVRAEVTDVSIAEYKKGNINNFLTLEDWAIKKQQERNERLKVVDERQLEIPTC